MSINISDNIRVNAGKPVDAKYLSSTNTPYASVAAVNAAIAVPERHIGLTVNVMGVEYWYVGGVADGNLVIKTAGGGTPTDAITGATNIGFFQGYTGVQTLPITHTTDPTYSGNYLSLYNYYYRGTDGRIHIGTPADGIPKRGYYNSAEDKSWIWNEYTGSGNLLGWILINGNISQLIGEFVNGIIYYAVPATFPYTNTSWSITPFPNGSQVVFSTIRGSLTTGNTLTIGGGVYAQEVNNVLEFKTIQTKSPETISISTDEAFVYVSGKTQVGNNLGTGANVYAGNTGTTLQFRSIIGSGGTIVTQSGNNIVIAGGSGGGSSIYDLSTPAAITLGGINAGDQLTGKTSNQILEQLLVPALPPAVQDPNNTFTSIPSTGSVFEIGQTIGITFTATFSEGFINPLYFGTPPYTSVARSGLPVSYNYTGTGLPASVSSSSLTNGQSIASYVVNSNPTLNTWTNSVTYASGATPVYDSKGAILQPALIAGTTTPAKSISISGLYPYFWGVSGSAPSAGQLLINGGIKAPIGNTSGNVTVNFGASGQYIWLALPKNQSGTKIKWYGSNAPTTNTEPIPGGLFNAPTMVSVNSPTSLWSGVNYDFYISNYATNTIGYTITFQ